MSFFICLSPQHRDHQTSSSLRERTQLIRVLNSFRVLHTIFMDTYRTWVHPAQKSITMGISTLAIYGVMKLGGRQGRIMGFAATFALLYLASLYRKLGLMYEHSVKLRQTCMYNGNSKWMQKYMRGVQVFRVDVGEYYFVHKTTVITILYTILNGTITLLLA